MLGNLNRGLVFVVSAPAGTGKTTLINMLINEFPNVVQSISYTTRDPRALEVDGVHYFFIEDAAFKKKIDDGDFLEYVSLYGQSYGTSKKWVEQQRDKGQHVVLVIDTQGALQLMEHFDATFIFVQPPSMEELKRRLETRQTESPEKISQRLKWAEKELTFANKYDYNIINDDLQNAYQALRAIVIAEEHRVKNLKEVK